jgi:hypothetical protein
MEDFKDKFSNIIRLTDKQWNHIIKEHQEVGAYKNRLSGVLTKPDLVKRSKRDKDTFLYYRYYKDIYQGKYLLVVVRGGLLLTCYITDRIKEGDTIWKRD